MMVFVSLFGFVGIALLVFLWKPSHGMMEPPWIFRIVGSLIALMFVAMGFGLPLSGLKAVAKNQPEAPAVPSENPETASTGYRCPSCGAALGQDQEVSPSGDVKCTYCKRWWNIHQGRT